MSQTLRYIRSLCKESSYLLRIHGNKHIKLINDAISQARINVFKDDVLSSVKGSDQLTEEQIRILALSIDDDIHIRDDGKIDVKGNFDCSSLDLTDLCGLRFGKIEGKFKATYNKFVNLEGFPIENHNDRSDNAVIFHCNRVISEKTLSEIYEIMIKNQMDYWSALCVVKSEIDPKDWAELSKGVDDNLDKDVQKGISMMARFGNFDWNHFFL